MAGVSFVYILSTFLIDKDLTLFTSPSALRASCLPSYLIYRLPFIWSSKWAGVSRSARTSQGFAAPTSKLQAWLACIPLSQSQSFLDSDRP